MRSYAKTVAFTWAIQNTGLKQESFAKNWLRNMKKRRGTMGRISDLYIDMLENMSEEERFEYEQKEALNDPEVQWQMMLQEKRESSTPVWGTEYGAWIDGRKRAKEFPDTFEVPSDEEINNIKIGASELEIAISGRDKMEREIAKTYPDAEYMDTWVWFQSGINTDGAHNPKTSRKLLSGDILSLNTFPMISGYYTALERTLFLNDIDDASLKAWEANIKVHKKGLELIKPGVKCSDICHELNDLFAQLGYLQYRTFGYGHSFGVLSHFYGRESGLELREDVDTILEPNMVVSMEPMIMIPEGKPGAGGYREHDILLINESGAENITKFPFGPEHNIVKN